MILGGGLITGYILHTSIIYIINSGAVFTLCRFCRGEGWEVFEDEDDTSDNEYVITEKRHNAILTEEVYERIYQRYLKDIGVLKEHSGDDQATGTSPEVWERLEDFKVSSSPVETRRTRARGNSRDAIKVDWSALGFDSGDYTIAPPSTLIDIDPLEDGETDSITTISTAFAPASIPEAHEAQSGPDDEDFHCRYVKNGYPQEIRWGNVFRK